METASEIIRKFLPNVRFGELEEEKEAPPKDGIFCKRCRNTGWIDVKASTGQIMKMRCPDCTLRRDQARYLRQSGIMPEDYARYTMETFRTDTAEAAQMKAMAVNYLQNHGPHQGIGFFGQSGAGKTHICIAICQALGKEHHYWQYRHEIQRIKAVMYKDLDRYEDMLKLPQTVPYLYVDDLFKGAWTGGMVDKQDVQIMFDILNMRSIKRLPTLVSSEYSLPVMKRADEGVESRIYQMISPYIMNVQGRNRREQ